MTVLVAKLADAARKVDATFAAVIGTGSGSDCNGLSGSETHE